MLQIQSDRALTDDMASGTQIIFTGATMPRGLSDLLEDIVPVRFFKILLTIITIMFLGNHTPLI